MKVLFFSYLVVGDNYKGGGWVDSLLYLLHEHSNYELAVVCPSVLVKTVKTESKDGLCYYYIPLRQNRWKSLLNRMFRKALIELDKEAISFAINDFSPDIIQLFGLETPFGAALSSIKDKPIVVHIQGIASSYYTKWFPMGFSINWTWWHSSLRDKILFATPRETYLLFCKLAEMEKQSFPHYHYYFGRTEWDYQISRLLAPSSKYYKCDEMLRSVFYSKKWDLRNLGKVIISTTTNGEIYKGFDTILRTADCLKQSGLQFEWNIYGVAESFSLKKMIELGVGMKFSECSVFFRGSKDAQELAEHLMNTTFYVHASHIDNSPNALCEAMLLGVPCIATYVGGVPSLIDDKVNGYLVSDNEPLQLASMIRMLCQLPDELKDISRAARHTAIERHNGMHILEQIKDAYNDVLNDFRERQNA
jgi:glycosyltransferase involved in cell wall biosynthesis